MINIAVLGYGTVGSGVVEVINKNHASINKRAGQEVNIKYVLDLRDFPGDPVEKVLVHDYNVIVNDPEVKIIVEVMGGIKPAYDFTKQALEAECLYLQQRVGCSTRCRASGNRKGEQSKLPV